MSSVIEQGRGIFRNAAIVGPEETATAFMEMLIGPAALADLRESPAWPGIVREAGRTAYEQFPVAYPPESFGRAERRLPSAGLYRRAQPPRSAEASAPAGGADTKAPAWSRCRPATHAVQQFTEHFHPALLAVTAGGTGDVV